MNNIMNKLADIAEQNKHVNDGDYIGSDGFLYCVKCHTPKQCRVHWFDGTEKTVTCVCKCESEAAKKAEEERRKEERMQVIEKNRRIGFPDKSMTKCTFANDDHANEKVTKIAKNFVTNFETFKANGKGIVFCGGVGTGKTYMASCIANALIDEGYTALVTNFSRIVNTLSGMYEGKQAYIDSLCEYGLLVIDDFGIERNTEYVNEIVYNVIDARYRSGKPLIITTNLKYSDLNNAEETSKARIYSRIIEMCLPVSVIGKDRRKNKAQDSRLMDILNS